MTPTLSPADLAAIRARCEAATKGPWGVEFYGSGQANVSMPRDRSFHFGTVYGASGISSGGSGKPILGVSGSELDGLTEAEYDRQRASDAYFIAAARTDIPLLLTALDAATWERDALRAVATKIVNMADADDHSGTMSVAIGWTEIHALRALLGMENPHVRT